MDTPSANLHRLSFLMVNLGVYLPWLKGTTDQIQFLVLKEVARLREQEEEIAKSAKAYPGEAAKFDIEQAERKKRRTRTALSLLLESTVGIF
jgi:hypothetical protein